MSESRAPRSRSAATAAPPGPAAAKRKARTLARLRRIEGQIRGLHRMVDEERRCTDVLTQLSSVQAALRAVGRELLRSHLKQCATAADRVGTSPADALFDELVDLMYKHVR